MGKKAKPLETLIGEDSIVRGEIISRGFVRTDGVVEGTVQVHHLLVGKSGAVHGDISVRTVEIDGSVEGNIVAEDTVEIRPGGVLEGDVKTVKLIIQEGAFFYGNSLMQKPVVMSATEEMPDEDTKVERIRASKGLQ